MDRDLEIAEKLTVGDWLDMKVRLQKDMKNNELWNEAIKFFDKRLYTRYLQPIEAIEHNSPVLGEGFSIVAILCSMIEALESFYQGKTYRKATKEKPLDEQKEYFKSQPLFESFLTKREPFNNHFLKSDLATDFYENLRCAILHEAATRNGWKINIKENTLIEIKDNQKILNRVLFVNCIYDYIKQYKKELLNNDNLKNAYIRKFDSICENA